eukprot:555826-Prorocentrum_minimum.AAC.1
MARKSRNGGRSCDEYVSGGGLEGVWRGSGGDFEGVRMGYGVVPSPRGISSELLAPLRCPPRPPLAHPPSPAALRIRPPNPTAAAEGGTLRSIRWTASTVRICWSTWREKYLILAADQNGER